MNKFLIADEETLFCCGLELILKELFAGVKVTTCFDPRSLMQTIENADVSHDLIMIDLNLAQYGNFKTLNHLSTMAGGIPIIVLSKSDDVDLIKTCMNNGADGYILKTATQNTLKLAISLVLSGEVYVPPTSFVAPPPQDNTPPIILYGKDNLLGSLTRRQINVLTLMMDGHPNKQIAFNLGMLENTVKAHVKAVLKKLNANNRTQAVIIASALGLSPRYDESPELHRS